MNPNKEGKASHSLDSSRVSSMSNSVPVNNQMKRMQAKLLMDYYRQNQQLKHKKSLQQTTNKQNYGYYEKSLTEDFLLQKSAQSRRKQQLKQNLASQYDEMIRLKQQKQRQQKQHERQLEKKNYHLSTWGRDNNQDAMRKKQMKQFSIQNQTRQQYGKQLQMHIRLQEMMRHQQKLKEKQMIAKFQQQQQEKNRSYDQGMVNNFKRREMFQRRQNEILGVDNERMGDNDSRLNSSNPEQLSYMNSSFKSIDLGQHDRRSLKRRQQMLYGSGLEQQLLRSQTISPKPNQRSSYQQSDFSIKSQKRFSDLNFNPSQVYNPITNPIQINYKNPYILRMFAEHNG